MSESTTTASDFVIPTVDVTPYLDPAACAATDPACAAVAASIDEACRTVGELETCRGQAAPPQVLGMLAWHAANVVPVLDITHSLEWPRPARSANAIVGASIFLIRLWVAIGILGVLKPLWDKWGPSGSSRHGPAT